MTAIGVALGLGFVLAYAAWKDWLRFRTPVAPHDALVAKVDDLERRIGSIESWVKR